MATYRLLEIYATGARIRCEHRRVGGPNDSFAPFVDGTPGLEAMTG
jgi:hypothetical protein